MGRATQLNVEPAGKGVKPVILAFSQEKRGTDLFFPLFSVFLALEIPPVFRFYFQGHMVCHHRVIGASH